MVSKLAQNWIPLEKVEGVVQLEPAVFIILMAATSWIVYKLFLRQISPERHRNLRALFKNLFFHSIFAICFFFVFWALFGMNDGASPALLRVLPYIGLITLIWGGVIFVKTCRIFAFEYLFFFNMQVGVPLLLVNLLSLLLSLWVGGWILSGIFEFRLAPLLATSAAFSIVLGLAMQDTLGNLFAGVSLQVDKPFMLGDWIEIYVGNQKIVGLVHEMTWRATVLIGFTDELITIPNRIVAQSQVSNFSGRRVPIIRSQLFRIPYGADLEQIRVSLLKACDGVKGIRRHPEPLVLLTESTESWILAKLVYHIEDYGSQYLIADELLDHAFELLEKEKIELAAHQILIKEKKKA